MKRKISSSSFFLFFLSFGSAGLISNSYNQKMNEQENELQQNQIIEQARNKILATRVTKDFASFVEYFFPLRYSFKFVWNWHHFKMACAIDALLRGDIQNLLVNIPPRYTKTEFFSIFLPAYGFAKNPKCKFITTSYSQSLTLLNSTRVQEIVKLPEYQALFPDTQLKKNSTSKEEWENIADGGIKAVSTGTGITGFGAGTIDSNEFSGCIIIDDPLKPQDRNSATMRANCIDYFTNTLYNRRNNENVPIVIIMQRLHEEDLSGFVLSDECELEFTHLCLPAINEDGTKILWEWKHNRRALSQLQTLMGQDFAGQYLQRPSPAEGAIFKEKYWKWYKPNTPEQPDYTLKIFTADCAEGEKEENDWRVIQCWGKYLNRAYLIDQLRYKADDETALIIADAFWDKHRPNYAIVEKASTGSSLITHWNKNKKPTRIYTPQGKGDKVARAKAVIGYFFNEQVYLPLGEEWINDFMTEHKTFPNAKHDDQVDCTTLGVSHILNDEGVLMYPEFNESYNVKENVSKILHNPLIISINTENEPAAIFSQLDEYGQLRILDSISENIKKDLFIRKISTKQIIDFNFSLNNVLILVYTGKNQQENPFDWINAIRHEFGVNPINHEISSENNDIIDMTAKYLTEVVVNPQTQTHEKKLILDRKNNDLIAGFTGGLTVEMDNSTTISKQIIKRVYPYTNYINCVHHLIYHIALKQKIEEHKRTKKIVKFQAKGL